MTTFRTMVLMSWLVVLLVTSSTLVPVLSTLETNLQTITLLSLLPAGCRVNSCSFIDYEESTSLSDTHSRILAHLSPTNAETWLKRTTENDSSYLSHFELCRHYWSQNQTQQAVDACHKVPNVGHYWIRLGLQSDQGSQPEKALAYFQMAANSDPDLPEAWYRLGRTQIWQEQYQAAIPSLQQALATGWPLDGGMYNMLGRAYISTGEVERGRQLLQEGIEHFPGTRGLYIELAESYRGDEDWHNAAYWYQQMSHQFPDDAVAWSRYANASAQLGRLYEAQQHYQMAVQLAPDDWGHWFSLAEVSAETGDTVTAVEAYERAMSLAVERTGVWLSAGHFFTEIGQFEQARSAFEHVLEIEPGNANASKALQQLRELN